MSSTRERKERFIKSFGDRATRDVVTTLFARYGLAMLSDEQIEEVTQEMVGDAMSRNKHTIRNRRIYQRQLEARGYEQ